jgi:hypothetical protein
MDMELERRKHKINKKVAVVLEVERNLCCELIL